jgi:hypothetical protein
VLQRPGICRNESLRLGGSGGTGHPTAGGLGDRDRPRLRHRPEVRGTLRKDGTPPTCRENRKRPPVTGTPAVCTAPLSRECAAAQRTDTHRATEPPPPLPASDHGGPPDRLSMPAAAVADSQRSMVQGSPTRSKRRGESWGAAVNVVRPRQAANAIMPRKPPV